MCQCMRYVIDPILEITLFNFLLAKLQSFHLYEVRKGRHMFDYESAAGQAFIKDREKRLKSYNWTATGIKLMIPDIDEEKDLGKYQGEVDIGTDNNQETIEVKEFFGESFIPLENIWKRKNVKK